ncbi:Calcium-binding protein 8, partial [Ophiophagus hannah]
MDIFMRSPAVKLNLEEAVLETFDMQRITLEELKHILYHAFQDHLTMKDIENIIINEEESLNENSGNCQTEFEESNVVPMEKQNNYKQIANYATACCAPHFMEDQSKKHPIPGNNIHFSQTVPNQTRYK